MLLTGGQISMGISSGIVFIFTFLLFLSGYVLQQQTVRSIQAAIRPKPLPPNPHRLSTSFPGAETPAIPNIPDHSILTPSRPAPKIAWTRLAHVQLVTDPSLLCNSLILFAQLRRQGSRAKRLLLYPAVWDARGTELPHLRTAKRLLKDGAVREGVTLRAVNPVFEGADPLNPTSYPLSILLSLTHYNAVLHLQTPSLIIATEALDTRLAQAPHTPVTLEAAGEIIRPSLRGYSDAIEAIRLKEQEGAGIEEEEILRDLFEKDPEEVSNGTDAKMVEGDGQILVVRTGEIELLRGESAENDVEQSVKKAGVVVFNDDGLRGPAFDVPRDLWFRSRPTGEAGRVWEGLWERFREERRGVCGLDLEVWT